MTLKWDDKIVSIVRGNEDIIMARALSAGVLPSLPVPPIACATDQSDP